MADKQTTLVMDELEKTIDRIWLIINTVDPNAVMDESFGLVSEVEALRYHYDYLKDKLQ